MTLISRCLSFPSRAAVVLLASWALVTTSAGAATLTVSGSGLSVQGGASVCTYSSISESGAGDWSVVCGSGSRTISINPPVNGTACASYTSITESGLGNWTVQGCGSLSPTITLDAPSQSGQTYPTGTAFTLKATASAPSGRTVSLVQFFADGNLIHAGNLSGLQYVWDWTPPTGTYLVLARVTDSANATADSVSRQMIFQPPPPQNTVYYVHPDQLGTPRAITRASDNQVVWRWDNTEAFGNSAPNENPNGLGSFTYNLRFLGQYFDSEMGTFYNYFRDYDPAIGRYVESDPIGLVGGPNPYLYVSGSPLTRYDPRGLKDYLGQCTGRYSSCSIGQDGGATTFGNWARWKMCEATVDSACKKAPVICCDADRVTCLEGFSPDGADTMTPEQIKKVAECNAKHATCSFRAGKK